MECVIFWSALDKTTDIAFSLLNIGANFLFLNIHRWYHGNVWWKNQFILIVYQWLEYILLIWLERSRRTMNYKCISTRKVISKSSYATGKEYKRQGILKQKMYITYFPIKNWRKKGCLLMTSIHCKISFDCGFKIFA